MAFPFTTLPLELFYYNILWRLGPEDVANLLECVHFEITEEIYTHFFYCDPTFPSYNAQMFKERLQARVYLLGRGEMTDNPDRTHFENLEPLLKLYRMCKPMKAELSEPVMKVSVSTQFVFIMTVSGKLYFTSCALQGVHAFCHQMKNPWCTLCSDPYKGNDCPVVQACCKDFLNRGTFSRGYHENGDAAYSMLWQKLYYKACTDARATPKYKDISSGESTMSHFNNDETVLYSGKWWNVNSFPLPLYVEGQSHARFDPSKIIRQRILRARSHSAFFEGRGIAVMMDMDQFPTPCLFIPNTETGVKDWALCRHCVVCLRTDGSVDLTRWQLDPSFDEPEQIFEEDLSKYFNALEKLNEYGPYAQISGSGDNLVLLTTKGEIIVPYCRFHSEYVPLWHWEISNTVSVVAGEEHFLALTAEGDVYSWGKENISDGCMGLGTLEQALAKGAKLKDYTLSLATPTKMELPGRVFSIDGGYEQSVMVMYNKEVS